MTTVTHKPTMAKCQVVSRYKDGDMQYVTLKEIVGAGEFARTFTATDDQIEWPQRAQVSSITEARAARVEKAAAPPMPEPEPVTSPVKDQGSDQVRLNDPLLTPGTLADSIIQGIGPITAGRILELRATLPDGKFRSMEDLKRIKGINWDAYADVISFE